MNIFEIVGIIAISIGSLGLLWVTYHVVRGFVLACDFILWQYHIVKRRDPSLKFSIRIFMRGVMKNWLDLIGYTPADFSCEQDGSVWQGFGSWRRS